MTTTTPHNFALTGVSGHVAPRHLKAIRDTGNRLVAAVKPHDSAGVGYRSSSAPAFRPARPIGRVALILSQQLARNGKLLQ
jgi:hypothetical protein